MSIGKSDFSGVALDGVKTPLTMLRPDLDRHIQVDITTGAGSLAVRTKVGAQTTFTEQIAAGTLGTKQIDMTKVKELELEATGSDIGYEITGWSEEYGQRQYP